MRPRFIAACFVLLALVRPTIGQEPANWPQFRGVNASGLANDPAPTEFGPAKRLMWKRELPPGHSSPAVWGDRIFLTGVDRENRKLEIICLGAKTGEVSWRYAITADQIEKVHEVSNAATATPAADADGVYAYFASYGVIALDHTGKQRWSVPLPMLPTSFGSGTSPVLREDMLLVNRDAVDDGYLIALDRRTGKVLWKTSYPPSPGRKAESYSTPVIWHGQAVLHRLGFVEGYDLKDGRRIWWVAANTTGTSTAVVSNDMVYAATWSNFGEADQIPPLPAFAAVLKDNDKDGNGMLSAGELPPTLYIASRPDTAGVPGASVPLVKFFAGIDSNKDGQLTEADWEQLRSLLATIRRDHGVVAIKPDGEGDLTSKIVWSEKLAVPEVPTPLVYKDRVYVVRNGGILTSIDAASGKVIYRARVGAPGPYYASPVAAGGKIYLSSGEGVVVVVTPGEELNVTARNDLGEAIYATPAFAGGTMYVRTVGHLYAFR